MCFFRQIISLKAETLVFNGIYPEALNHLQFSLILSRKYYMNFFANVCIIMIATISSLIGATVESTIVNSANIFEIFTNVCHQAEPALIIHLCNLKLWLSHGLRLRGGNIYS